MSRVYGSSTFARPPPMPPTNQYQYHSPDGTSKWKGPRRVCIFCTMAVVLPSLLISVPLLMRFVIYGSSTYIIHPSDMRVLDTKISTTWCEGETIRMNSSFTAYVTSGEPSVFTTPTTLTVDQSMKIPDDQKEYWGLYLLPGSTFKIRTCARHRGGTLLIVRGNKHLEYCAYVGENDSAGNSDEVSDSTSVEAKGKHRTVGGAKKSKEKTESHNDLTILSKLKNFLQSHPHNRDKIQKTLEDWMLLNSSKSSSENLTMDEEFPLPKSEIREELEITTTSSTKGSTDPPTSESVERGTIRRRRRAVEFRRDTESGENGAFEDDSVDSLNEISGGVLRANQNLSIVDLKPFQTPESIWKEQHSHHSGSFNQSLDTPDGSESESESSFSSSEEALLKCEGIIANFRIPQETDCVEEGSYEELNLTKTLPGLTSNVFQFQVAERDYYYFIFGSENEKETNTIRAKFELKKVEYQLPDPIENCTSVEECQISFRFASSQKVVIRLPQPLPNASSTVIYLAETECKPRAHLYLIFVILVPLVILCFAFQ